MWANHCPIGKRGAKAVRDDDENDSAVNSIPKLDAVLTRDVDYLARRNQFAANAAQVIQQCWRGPLSFTQKMANANLETTTDIVGLTTSRNVSRIAARAGKHAFVELYNMIKECEDDFALIKQDCTNAMQVLFLKDFQKHGKVGWALADERMDAVRLATHARELAAAMPVEPA
jgi:hypothetical protein